MIFVAALALGLIVTLELRPPAPAVNPPSHALAPDPGTPLWELHSRVEQRFGTGSVGILALDDPGEALGWRVDLIDLAEHSIDAQYYKWADDTTGRALLDRVLAAADRGVRVRLLLDDAGLKGADRRIAAIDRHTNVEIRVFNPWGSRASSGARTLEWLLHRKTLNRRMHNKLLVVDNTVAVAGGRNIADRFFGRGESFNVADLDLLLAGGLVRDLSDLFDAFWNSDRVHLAAGRGAEDSLDTRARSQAVPSGWSERLAGAVGQMTSGDARLLWDPPAEGGIDSPDRMIQAIERFADEARSELIISSAFVVPDDEVVAWFERLTERGVRVRILTNSLASNIGTIAHSGYKSYRERLLVAGVELYELRDDAQARDEWRLLPNSAERLAIHAKAIVVDRRTVFIGSFNLDQRSIDLNTEMGVVVESPELARQVAGLVERHMAPENAWSVTFGDDGRLVWRNSDRTVARQPARGKTQRMKDWLYGLLPIKGDL
jgi:putative cardiolipin synthase